jgi:hypothetical protein
MAEPKLRELLANPPLKKMLSVLTLAILLFASTAHAGLLEGFIAGGQAAQRDQALALRAQELELQRRLLDAQLRLMEAQAQQSQESDVKLPPCRFDTVVFPHATFVCVVCPMPGGHVTYNCR